MSKTDLQRHQEALLLQLGGHEFAADEAPSLSSMRIASGIDDEALLAGLIKLGIRPDSLMLMSVAPVVALAWIDGKVQTGEREAILRAAAGKGIVDGTAPYALLEKWLSVRPGGELLEAWEAFVKVIIAGWDHDKAARFRGQLGALAREVAEAAGGVLGVGAVSKDEAAIIARIEGAFDLASRQAS